MTGAKKAVAVAKAAYYDDVGKTLDASDEEILWRPRKWRISMVSAWNTAAF